MCVLLWCVLTREHWYTTPRASQNTPIRLATEWADRGVRVNAISPGIVNTPLIQSSPTLAPLVDQWLTHIPTKRLAEVTDLQAAVVYLASEASGYMTGHNMVIEGGQSLW